MKHDKLYIGTNTKMYKTISQTESFLYKLCEYTEKFGHDEIELFVIPSFTTLSSAGKILSKGTICLGAQNMAWEEEGAYSGEISPLMLKEVGTQIVMIGHSERRHILGETDEMENWKIHCALKHNFKALLCIGETDQQRQWGCSDEVLKYQLKVGLYGIKSEDAINLRIAYEPVWAIGENGISASKEYAEERHIVIRETLIWLFGEKVGNMIPILYGGSVNPQNAGELIQMEHIDGLFIGRSAWEAEKFCKIIEEVFSFWKQK